MPKTTPNPAVDRLVADAMWDIQKMFASTRSVHSLTRFDLEVPCAPLTEAELSSATVMLRIELAQIKHSSELIKEIKDLKLGQHTRSGDTFALVRVFKR